MSLIFYEVKIMFQDTSLLLAIIPLVYAMGIIEGSMKMMITAET